MRNLFLSLLAFYSTSGFVLADLAVPGIGILGPQSSGDVQVLLVAILLGFAAVAGAILVGIILFLSKKNKKKK